MSASSTSPHSVGHRWVVSQVEPYSCAFTWKSSTSRCRAMGEVVMDQSGSALAVSGDRRQQCLVHRVQVADVPALNWSIGW